MRGTSLSSKYIESIYNLHDQFSALSLQYYLDNVVINSSPAPRAWRTIREPWQDEILRRKVPAFEVLAGLRARDTSTIFNHCDILPRGHDKSSLEARLATWLLCYSRTPIDGYILAADKDQGEIVLAALREESDLNPWIAKKLKISKKGVSGPAGSVTVVPADASSAYGFRGNLFIFDEYCNWGNTASVRDTWNAVFSGTEKRDPTICTIISNAGYIGSWQERVYKALVAQPEQWAHFSAPGPLASWMSETNIAAKSKLLGSQSEADRLFRNKWVSSAEQHDFLQRWEIDRCVDTRLMLRLRRPLGVTNCIAAIDYGPKKDRTVLIVGAKDAGGVFVVFRMDVLCGADYPDGKVKVAAVEQWIREITKTFAPAEWVVDPYQMVGTIEYMRDTLHLPVFEFTARGGAANFDLAQQLRGCIASRSVAWYPKCGRELETEIEKLVVKKMSYGFRIDHTSTEHDDQAVALGMALVRAEHYPCVPGVSPLPDPGIFFKV